ncbi:BLUF domain-containing protein [Curtobacterium sp. VKM Ac-2922]|uniref:BLUF domain-containing protein n=1 Tax=Curtobacterium sp. VKM Ac-2922 TaxID=2929475 RepID=UPI001FB460A5|nr:BLUF domain-containing protein [Curtobacterium sp. VKM Ac-2922]MCJ1715793.1 BLUF domain-containing protein [Curtobacterium sp. VKM Ac-2922]
MTLRSLVFTCARTGRFSVDDLVGMLPTAAARNADLGVTGILAMHDDNVMGVLEGPEDVVRAQFAEVAADPANLDVQVLCDDPIAASTFASWSLALRTDDPRLLATPGFVDLFDPRRAQDPEAATSRAHALLEWFRRTPPVQLSTRRLVAPAQERAVTATIELLREIGPARCTLGAVATRAGLPPEQLAALFPTVHHLLAAALGTWLGSVSAPLAHVATEQGTIPWLRAMVVALSSEPALDRLIVFALATAADAGDTAAEPFLATYRAFRAGIRQALEADIAAGREPASTDPVRGARQLLALFDGLRIQNLFDPEPDVADAFHRAAEQLRTGWSHDQH